jgi:hypothetical protein
MGDYVPDGTSLITRLDAVDVAQLRTYHRNPRKGSIPAIRQSLEVNRQYRPIVVNKGTYTDRPSEVLAGNHTLVAARDLGWRTLAVVWVDVDDDQAARINLADNRVPEIGEGYDERLLLELLSELPDLDGTGYDPGDLDDLVAALEETEPAPPTGDGNMRRTPGLDDLAEDYEASGTRMVVLVYEGARYVWVVDQLAELGQRFKLDSNADVVLRLIEQATGQQPPPEDEEPADG